RVGLGGAQMFTVFLRMEGPDGKPVEGPIEFLSPEWRQLVKHAVSESHRLGLEFSMMQSEGWGQAGGTTVTPEQTMQIVVWTERQVEGSKQIALQLPKPETKLDYYEDIALLAFPSVPGDEATAPQKVTSSAGGEPVTFGRDEITLPLPMPDAPQWVQLEF